MVTLYGRGAISVHDDKNTYRPQNGTITVPPELVAQVLAMGWTRDYRQFEPLEPAIDVQENKLASIEDLRKMTPAEEAAFTHLLASGMTKSEALDSVLPGLTTIANPAVVVSDALATAVIHAEIAQSIETLHMAVLEYVTDPDAQV